MKKFIALGVLALSVAVLSTPQASAWTNLKFGAGINFGYQAGGNNFGWGLFRNGQPPCADNCGGGAPAPAPYGNLQPGSYDQGFVGGMAPPSAAAGANAAPAQPQSYNRTNYTVNYQYFPYNYSYGNNYGYGYGYNR